MNALYYTSILLLILLFFMSLFASSVGIFFTRDELNEMGIRIEPPEGEGESVPA